MVDNCGDIYDSLKFNGVMNGYELTYIHIYIYIYIVHGIYILDGVLNYIHQLITRGPSGKFPRKAHLRWKIDYHLLSLDLQDIRTRLQPGPTLRVKSMVYLWFIMVQLS